MQAVEYMHLGLGDGSFQMGKIALLVVSVRKMSLLFRKEVP